MAESARTHTPGSSTLTERVGLLFAELSGPRRHGAALRVPTGVSGRDRHDAGTPPVRPLIGADRQGTNRAGRRLLVRSGRAALSHYGLAMNRSATNAARTMRTAATSIRGQPHTACHASRCWCPRGTEKCRYAAY